MENNLKLVCPKCGTPHQPHSPHTMDADGFERCEIRTIMEDKGWCYECSFWQNMYDKHKDDPGWYSFEDAYEFNYGKNKEEKVKVVDSCYKRRW